MTSLGALVRDAWRVSPDTFAIRASQGRWKLYAWLELVAATIADAAYRGGGRVILNAPPRHGKSELVSHWCPTWYLDRWPHKRIIMASYGDQLASHWGRVVRAEITGNPLVRTQLSEDSRAAGIWHTPEGGGMISVGVGGAITGFGGDLVLVDDPTKNWADAHSPTERTKLIDWFNGTLWSRLEPDASMVILMQRWHEDDLCGYLMEEHGDDWQVLRLPAIAEADDLLGRADGEPLCPERYSLDALHAWRAGTTEAVWQACFQQNPTATSAGRVYRAFSTSKNIVGDLELEPGRPLCLSLDFNINPGMHAIVGQWSVRADRMTAVHEIHGPRMNLPDCMAAFERLLRVDLGAIGAKGLVRFPEIHVFGDSTGKAEWVGTSESCWSIVRRELRRMKVPFRIRVPATNPRLANSIEAMNDCLCDTEGRCHYFVHPRCTRLIEDFRELRSDVNGLIDKRDLALSHASDCERYRVSYVRPVKPPTIAKRGRWSTRVGV